MVIFKKAYMIKFITILSKLVCYLHIHTIIDIKFELTNSSN